jgi:hypothetical protein
MITLNVILNNLKTIGIAILIILVVWFYKDYQHQKIENIRQTENNRQLRISDSVRFTSQNLNTEEIKEYLDYENKDLKAKLEKDRVKLNRIESIVSTNYKYSDNSDKETDLINILKAIKNNVPGTQEVIDTSNCMTIKGKVSFDGVKLKLNITDREFKNKSDGVAYWERKQWTFLGIKSRLLGKKQFTAKTYDQCGESQILKIEKKK